MHIVVDDYVSEAALQGTIVFTWSLLILKCLECYNVFELGIDSIYSQDQGPDMKTWRRDLILVKTKNLDTLSFVAVKMWVPSKNFS